MKLNMFLKTSVRKFRVSWKEYIMSLLHFVIYFSSLDTFGMSDTTGCEWKKKQLKSSNCWGAVNASAMLKKTPVTPYKTMVYQKSKGNKIKQNKKGEQIGSLLPREETNDLCLAKEYITGTGNINNQRATRALRLTSLGKQRQPSL